MAFADDLLEQAKHLANREPKRPRQASLRRAVSTAYYSLFHLLISASISNWKNPIHRPQIARGFEHSAMKVASKKTANRIFDKADAVVGGHLKIVAQAFVDLQQHRHFADYDYAKKWSKTQVRTDIDTAFAA